MDNVNENLLIPLAHVTGALNHTEALLIVSYSSAPTVRYKDETYMYLKDAIFWNEREIPMSSGIEKEFRELLVCELKKTLETGEFTYTDELVEKWACAFKKQSEALVKSKSKSIPEGLRVLVKSAIST